MPIPNESPAQVTTTMSDTTPRRVRSPLPNPLATVGYTAPWTDNSPRYVTGRNDGTWSAYHSAHRFTDAAAAEWLALA